jgi:SSS family solute:Na+ symporter/sodium/proline symporter
MTLQGALTGMIVGAATVLFWIYAPFTINGVSLSSTIFEIVPGFILGMATIIIVSVLTSPPSSNIQSLFAKMQTELEQRMR